MPSGSFPDFKNQYKEVRLLPQMRMNGPAQMALDELLLEESLKNKSSLPVLRFYTWEGTWLSIGRNQNNLPSKWKDLVINEKVQIVRRPSGGNAVLHSGGLTYALIMPMAPRKKHQAYIQASEWLVKGFSELGLPLHFGSDTSITQPSNCFASSSLGDLVDANGQKRIGSAQLWKKGHLLQHGEILLDPPKELWLEVFNSFPPKPAPSFIPREGLDKLLEKATKELWPEINWQSLKLSKIEASYITKKAPSYLVSFN